MTRYKCIVSYVGDGYEGWQSQRKGNSVQEQIESALHEIAHAKINIIAAGRTDAGVSAWGQVFTFDSDMDLNARKWKGALNGHLPKDIRIRECETAEASFHVRYNVRWKQYDYKINLGEYNVFSCNQVYQCPIPLDIEKMEEASHCLVGTHDFSSFSANSWKDCPDQVRTIYAIDFSREKDVLNIRFKGTGFLRYMVRMMTAALIEVGRGRMSAADVKEMLDAKSKTIARRNAAPQGLTLYHVDYYQIPAINQKCMIREFLGEDNLPEGHDLQELENLVSENACTQYYAFVTRNNRKRMGTFVYTREKDKASGIFYLLDYDNDLPLAESLSDSIETWMREGKGIEHVSIQVQKL